MILTPLFASAYTVLLTEVHPLFVELSSVKGAGGLRDLALVANHTTDLSRFSLKSKSLIVCSNRSAFQAAFFSVPCDVEAVIGDQVAIVHRIRREILDAYGPGGPAARIASTRKGAPAWVADEWVARDADPGVWDGRTTKPVENSPPTGDALDCSPIFEVQGRGETSPRNGEAVKVCDVVVTAVEASSFFVQTLRGQDDSSSATSEGLYVWGGKKMPDEGSLVTVAGTVIEDHGRTTLEAGRVDVTRRSTPLPVDVATVSSLKHGLERYEGMLVNVRETLLVTALDRAYEDVVACAGDVCLRVEGLSVRVGSAVVDLVGLLDYAGGWRIVAKRARVILPERPSEPPRFDEHNFKVVSARARDGNAETVYALGALDADVIALLNTEQHLSRDLAARLDASVVADGSLALVYGSAVVLHDVAVHPHSIVARFRLTRAHERVVTVVVANELASLPDDDLSVLIVAGDAPPDASLEDADEEEDTYNAISPTGQRSSVDRISASAALRQACVGHRTWHINADEPDTYYVANSPLSHISAYGIHNTVESDVEKPSFHFGETDPAVAAFLVPALVEILS